MRAAARVLLAAAVVASTLLYSGTATTATATATASGRSGCLADVPAPARQAYAPASDATARPVVAYPLGIKWANHTGRVVLAVEGPRDTWGLRTFAREAACQLHMTIYTRGTCADHPAAVCVRVVERPMDRCHCYADTVVSSPFWRTVRLNTDDRPPSPYAAVVHEFGHVLGLRHHRLYGVDGGWGNVIHFSRVELHALRQSYDHPQE